ncbi:hypothetical protein Droror1_Dr00025436 [Drosera rotundifolia]
MRESAGPSFEEDHRDSQETREARARPEEKKQSSSLESGRNAATTYHVLLISRTINMTRGVASWEIQCSRGDFLNKTHRTHPHLFGFWEQSGSRILWEIELSAEILANVKFIQEKKLIGKYFEEISHDTRKYVFGVEDTLKALDTFFAINKYVRIQENLIVESELPRRIRQDILAYGRIVDCVSSECLALRFLDRFSILVDCLIWRSDELIGCLC